jgi:hypothetical protein
LALVAEGGLWEDKRWGYIDRTGKIIISFQFERAEDFSDGLAPVVEKAYADMQKERYFYIDKNGKRSLPGNFALASPFFKGIAHVKIPSRSSKEDRFYDGTYAYIDVNGRQIFSYVRDNE